MNCIAVDVGLLESVFPQMFIMKTHEICIGIFSFDKNQEQKMNFGFDIFTSVIMKNFVFGDITPCSR
jgi:hypothetical protein